ncbi:Uncharacterized protein dnm_043040 [Desulfonema magnum]|uniref:Uncharacterized protein n=1 Tax=Desulfonema magnum TaxID=45655 RepID=A0A975BN09_9BACT|nr:Uncharacterized protein dnm_043040 [Desulfonema magnum]
MRNECKNYIFAKRANPSLRRVKKTAELRCFHTKTALISEQEGNDRHSRFASLALQKYNFCTPDIFYITR